MSWIQRWWGSVGYWFWDAGWGLLVFVDLSLVFSFHFRCKVLRLLLKKELWGGPVFSRRTDTACMSRLKRCSQTFGRKPCFAENIPVWLCSSSAFYWVESKLKLTCKGMWKRQTRDREWKLNILVHVRNKAFLRLDAAGLQFAELLPSVQITDHHFFHSASLQTEQSFFQTPRSH